MRAFIRVALLAAAFALGTWILGWWAVPLLGAAWGIVQRGRPRFAAAFVAAALAWAALLAFDALGGALGRLSTVLGGIFMLPGVALLAVTLLYAALLAGCAAQVAGTVGVARGSRGA
jgi:hypothetical protein